MKDGQFISYKHFIKIFERSYLRHGVDVGGVMHVPAFSFLSRKNLFGDCHFFVLAVEEIFFFAYLCQTVLDFFVDALEIYLAAWGLHLL